MIEGLKINLRALKEEDQIDLFNTLINDVVKKTFIINKEYKDINEFRELFDRLFKLSNQEKPLAWGISEKNNDKIIGIITIPKINDVEYEVGYAIHPFFHNKGYATESLSMVIKHIFKETDINYIIASHFTDNNSSKRVILKCGLHFRNTIINEIYYHNKYESLHYYQISREEYEKFYILHTN